MKKLLLVILALGLSSSVVARADGEIPREPYSKNRFRLNAIEYWAHGGYDGGNGVSFGYETNNDAWSQYCARVSFSELKKAMGSRLPEHAALRNRYIALGGATGIYLIVSDWTNRTPIQGLEQGVLWHYNGNPNGTGGLIKFHVQTRNEATEDGFFCSHPSVADFYAYLGEIVQEMETPPTPPTPPAGQ